MALIRSQPLVLIVATFLFAVGHGHQILGQFEAHHHHGWEMHSLGEVHEHEGGEHHEDHGDPGKDSDHMLADHMVTAIAPAPVIAMVIALQKAALVAVIAETVPEAPVAGIEHPPQLA